MGGTYAVAPLPRGEALTRAGRAETGFMELTNGGSPAAPETPVTAHSRFAGALLGVMAGDSLGASVEGWTGERVNQTLDLVARLPRNSPYRALYDGVLGALSGRLAPGRAYYTDDTQMMLGVAESLLAEGGFDGADMAARLVANFDGRRSYGPGVYSVLQNLKRGVAWNEAGTMLFGGEGALGNGGAVRVAPVAVLYYDAEPAVLRRVAELSASITHTHPTGRAGAALLAFAIALAMRTDATRALDPLAFLNELRAYALGPGMEAYRAPLDSVATLLHYRPTWREVAETLGVGIESHRSVPTALYCFLAHPGSFCEAVMSAIRLGGDTDTIGAMTGALAGAHLGEGAIPEDWIILLENEAKGRDYARRLADGLYLLNQRQDRPK